ncbi:MAG TPA: hypothetical protein VM529_20425 [Gemmata sp.]|nr:hypothetical protein [Gemmata sp.]
MELVIPLLAVGTLVVLAAGFLLARRDAGSGPNPDDRPGRR